MAAMISTWEQTGQYDPTNPNQRTYVQYAGIPGGYASYYYNRVPTTAKLQGLAAAMPNWMTVGLVVLGGAVVGYLGARHAPAGLKKRLGLSGHRRR